MRARTAIIGGASATLLLALALALMPAGLARTAVADVSALAAAILVAVAAAWRAPRAHRPLAWRLLAAGAALFALAEGYWTWQEVGARTALPAASLADLVYYAGYGFLVAALVALFPERDGLRPRVRRGLDALALAATLMAILWIGLIDRWADPSGTGEMAALVAAAYPALDLALAGSFALLAAEVTGPARRRLGLLSVGALLWAVGDLAYARDVLVGGYPAGGFLDAAWIAGYLAMAAAAVVRPAQDQRLPDAYGPTRASALALYGPIAVLLPLAAWDFAAHRTMDTVLFGLGLVIVAAITARQVLLSWDLLRSNRDLGAANERFRMAERATSDVLWDLDLRTDRLLWGATFKDVFGHADVVTPLSGWSSRVHPEDLPRVQADFEAVLAGPDTTLHFQYRFRRGDGSYADVLDRAFIVRDVHGEAVRLVGALQDISHRKAAEEALRRSEQSFHSLADNFPDYITRFDRDLKRVYANPAVRDLWRRMGAPDPQGLTVQQATVAPAEAARELEQTLRDALADGQIRELRQTVPTPAGPRRLLGTIVPERGADGRIESLLAVARDVTETDAAKQRLQASEERYRLLAETSSDLVQAFDAAGVCTYCSPSSLGVLGYAPEELVGHNGLTLLHPDDAEALREGRLASRRPDGTHVVEARARHKKGSWIWIETISRDLVDAEGRVRGHVASTRDVSGRHAAVEALRASEERLRTLLDNLDEGYVSIDLTTGVATNSRAIERIFGHPQALYDADPMLWSTQVLPEDRDRVLASYAQLLAGKATQDDCRILRPDGQTRWVRASMRPVADATGIIVRVDGVIRDITAERAAEEHKLEVKRLEGVAAFKTQFLNSAAHELATPLTPIKLQMSSLRRGLLGSMEPRQLEALDLLDRNLDRLNLLVQDLLDAARLQEGKLRLQAKPLPVSRVAREVLRSFAEKARQDGIRLGGRGLDSTAEVLGDDARLAQVLFNLVHNAIKFTPRDGSVEIRVATEGTEAVVSVQDTGIGLEPEQRARLFEPFTQVHDDAQRNVGGTGLGLYVSRGIVEQHGGRLTCASDGRGRGSTFTVRLPLRAAVVPPSADRAPGPRPAA